jgi:serine protease Do
MRTWRLRAVMGIAVLMLATLACNFSFSTAKIKDARLARDDAGEDETTVFLPDETFYVVGDLSNAPDDTRLKAVWTAVEAEGEDPDTAIGEKEVTAGSGEFSFHVSNDSLWPDGRYQVELYLDDKKAETIEFEVSATGRPVGAVNGRQATDEPSADEHATAAPASPAEGGVSALDDARSAVIQIEAQGSFEDPQEGLRLNQAGSGSGFIIDPEGIAVTNNHVVTGAAIIKVRVGGEGPQLRARILGVSECSDLAVIDIEGDGYPFLGWYDGNVKPGLDVYAAGFPLGEGEFTLTRGIVSQQNANGESDWASVERVIQHDATINPGNSGGPLLDGSGRVVGVNFAGNADTSQYYAIKRDEALDVIDRLREGVDVNSIGVNGVAVHGAEGETGIWVYSVRSGSPANTAGIKGGDVITKVEGLQLATDGTMKDYCDILRSHEPDDVLRVEVLRTTVSPAQVFEGELNGRVLEASTSFAQVLQGEVPTEAPGASEETTTEYATVEDDTNAIALQVPADWSDVDGSAWYRDDAEIGVSITASRSNEDFLNTYGTPGVFFGASRSLAETYAPGEMLDAFKGDLGVDECTFESRKDYADPFYKGVYETYTACGGDENAKIVALAAMPEDESVILFLLVQVASEADLKALDKILDTFQVIGDLP